MANGMRAYLLATTDSKQFEKTKQVLMDFAGKHNLQVSDFYVESKPNGNLASSELLRLTHDTQYGDTILIENTDVLLALSISLWQQLSVVLKEKAVRLVVTDIPTTWLQLDSKTKSVDVTAVNDLLIELLSSFAQRELVRVKRSQAAGIRKAQLQGKYEGRKPDIAQYKAIIKLITAGKTYKQIENKLGCSSRTIARAKKWHEAPQRLVIANIGITYRWLTLIQSIIKVVVVLEALAGIKGGSGDFFNDGGFFRVCRLVIGHSFINTKSGTGLTDMQLSCGGLIRIIYKEGCL